MNQPPIAIRASNVFKAFGQETVLRDVSFELPAGKILGMIGPSGSGKTTALRLLLGIYEPTRGNVSVMGREPRDFGAADKIKLGYMPQLFVLYPQLTVWENLNFAASIYGLSLTRRRDRLAEVLRFVELDEHRHKLARNISGGMQRRLSLAATLVHSPPYLFLDEPTAGVDPVLRRKFWDHFRQLRDAGSTLFVTTQYVGEAAYCDLVAVMARGQVLMVETPEILRKKAYGGEIVHLTAQAALGGDSLRAIQAMPFVMKPVQMLAPNQINIVVDEASTAMPALIEWCRANGVAIESIEEFIPPYDDIFVALIRQFDPGAD